MYFLNRTILFSFDQLKRLMTACHSCTNAMCLLLKLSNYLFKTALICVISQCLFLHVFSYIYTCACVILSCMYLQYLTKHSQPPRSPHETTNPGKPDPSYPRTDPNETPTEHQAQPEPQHMPPTDPPNHEFKSINGLTKATLITIFFLLT